MKKRTTPQIPALPPPINSLLVPSFFSSHKTHPIPKATHTLTPLETFLPSKVAPPHDGTGAPAEKLPTTTAKPSYSVDDYFKLDGQTFGAMKVRYKPERAKFYVSLSYKSADFELNRRDLKRIAQPFNQRLKIWPIPTTHFDDLVTVLCRAEKRAKRRLNQTAQVIAQKSKTPAPSAEQSFHDSTGREWAKAFLNQQFGAVQVKEVQGFIGLEFPYGCAGFYKIKENIKNLEGWSYKNKCWRVPFRYAEQVQEILNFAADCSQTETQRLAGADAPSKNAEKQTESLQEQQMAELQQSIEWLKQHVQKKGIYTKTPSHVQGETLLNTMDRRGTGECWVIETDKIWFVRNNGRGQDDWRYNNIATPSGGGAIGVHIPYQPHIAKMLRHAEHSNKG